MRASTLLAGLSTTALTSARLVGIAAPDTLAPSQSFDLILLTENYIQSVADIAVAWGYSLAPGYPHTLGSYPNSVYLGPSKSNQLKNVTITTTAPSELENWKGKDIVLSAGLYSLYGVSGSTAIANFNVTVKVGDATSDDLVRSDDFTWGTGQC